ncbi:hypothetical protein L596_026501 [Steinernema carpocapsae]|uniref:Uncharacterized protein n=1 Tax=Steinernema carpocapsae TaxID=34508 RepID=A0A4U5M1M5_STECR|nr:hypothetical protein L596_026501 [Steinernema carpocapsae]
MSPKAPLVGGESLICPLLEHLDCHTKSLGCVEARLKILETAFTNFLEKTEKAEEVVLNLLLRTSEKVKASEDHQLEFTEELNLVKYKVQSLELTSSLIMQDVENEANETNLTVAQTFEINNFFKQDITNDDMLPETSTSNERLCETSIGTKSSVDEAIKPVASDLTSEKSLSFTKCNSQTSTESEWIQVPRRVHPSSRKNLDSEPKPDEGKQIRKHSNSFEASNLARLKMNAYCQPKKEPSKDLNQEDQTMTNDHTAPSKILVPRLRTKNDQKMTRNLKRVIRKESAPSPSSTSIPPHFNPVSLNQAPIMDQQASTSHSESSLRTYAYRSMQVIPRVARYFISDYAELWDYMTTLREPEIPVPKVRHGLRLKVRRSWYNHPSRSLLEIIRNMNIYNYVNMAVSSEQDDWIDKRKTRDFVSTLCQT